MALEIEETLPELAAADGALAAANAAEGAPAAGRERSGAAGPILRGAQADAYIERLVAAIRGARLNALFPPERALCTHLSFLSPSGCEALHDELGLAPQSGLPDARAIFRVKIDRDLAGPFLHGPPREAPAGSRAARRVAYYTRLVAAPIMPLHRMRVELRKHIPEDNLALFRVVFDRFDVVSCQFVRYTILLGQRDGFWRRKHVRVNDEDLAAPTEAFRRAVSRMASDAAELAFLLLSRLDGVEVEDVRRCRVGPLLLPGAGVGGDIGALLDGEQTPELAGPRWILCFPDDRAGKDVAAHAAQDPLASLYRDALGAQARALVEARSDELGYRVARSRKLVCPHALREPLARACQRLGAPSIVRGV